MRFIPFATRVLILKCLTEGNSLRGTARIAEVSRGTVSRMLRLAGHVCLEHQRNALVNLPCDTLQLDEIWSFVHAKEKNLPEALKPPPEAGDIWTWVALCSETKLIITWYVGDRTINAARELTYDLRPRLVKPRVQITTDGNTSYLEPMEEAFGGDADYAQTVKATGDRRVHSEADLQPQTEFITKRVINGNPDEDKISTSHVERQNGTMRTHIRRLMRRTNGFSRKAEYHRHQHALHFMVYNYCRIHSSLRVTPAMAAGVTGRVWHESEIVLMMEGIETKAGPRGSYLVGERKAAFQARVRAARPGRMKRRIRARERVMRKGRSAPPSYVRLRAAIWRAAKH